MAGSDQLLQRNKDLEATRAHKEASIIARHQVYVITFLDPGTEPSASLELASAPVPGEPQFEVAVVHTVRADAERLRSGTVLPNTISISGHVYEVTTGPGQTGEWVLMSAQKAPAYYDGSLTRPAEVMAGHEAAPPPGPSRAEVQRRLA